MRVISNTVVLFVVIYCADEIGGKKRNRNNENEILEKTDIMLTKNQIGEARKSGPFKRNMVQVVPVPGKKYCQLYVEHGFLAIILC